jgi:glycerol transport system ATP-binding protein
MGIVVENVTQIYEGKTVLDDISLEVKDGDLVTFFAPTGHGKTTLLRVMAGVDKPDKGKIYYDGKDVTNVNVGKRNVAMVYQWFINYPSMTVYENIASPLRVSKEKFSKEEIDRRVRETADLMKIGALLDQHPSEISGGQQQRLAIARSIVKKADYIFLDEPLTNLDYKLREELRLELKKIFRDRDRGAVIFATPEPVDALSLSTHVGFLNEGRLLQYGPVDEVYHNPLFKEVGAFFSYPSMNIFECVKIVEGTRVWLQATDQLKIDVAEFQDTLKEDRYLLGIRAHALSVVKKAESMIPIQATVKLSEVVGSDTELHLDHQGIHLVVLLQGMGSYALDSEITVYVHTNRFFVYDKASGKLIAKTHLD